MNSTGFTIDWQLINSQHQHTHPSNKKEWLDITTLDEAVAIYHPLQYRFKLRFGANKRYEAVIHLDHGVVRYTYNLYNQFINLVHQIVTQTPQHDYLVQYYPVQKDQRLFCIEYGDDPFYYVVFKVDYNKKWVKVIHTRAHNQPSKEQPINGHYYAESECALSELLDMLLDYIQTLSEAAVAAFPHQFDPSYWTNKSAELLTAPPEFQRNAVELALSDYQAMQQELKQWKTWAQEQ